VALFVSYVVLPSNAMRGLRKDAGALMMPLANLLSLATKPDDAEARDKFTRLNNKTRRGMRELTIAARQIKARRGEEDGETLPNRFTAALGRAHGAIVFVARALGSAPLPAEIVAALRPFVRDARARLGEIHHLLANGTRAGSGATLDATTTTASARIAACARGDAGAHLEALPFLIQTLRDDLGEMAALADELSGPDRRAIPAAAGAALTDP
jgi:hypothetical protein